MEKRNWGELVKREVPLWLFTLLGMYIATGILLMLLAFLVYQFRFGETFTDVSILIVYILINFGGGFWMGKKKKVKKYIAGFLTGTMYFLILVAVSLICNHGLQDFAGNFFTTLAICAGAGTIGGMLS